MYFAFCLFICLCTSWCFCLISEILSLSICLLICLSASYESVLPYPSIWTSILLSTRLPLICFSLFKPLTNQNLYFSQWNTIVLVICLSAFWLFSFICLSERFFLLLSTLIPFICFSLVKLYINQSYSESHKPITRQGKWHYDGQENYFPIPIVHTTKWPASMMFHYVMSIGLIFFRWPVTSSDLSFT